MWPKPKLPTCLQRQRKYWNFKEYNKSVHIVATGLQMLWPDSVGVVEHPGSKW